MKLTQDQGRELLVAVLTQHVAGDGLVVDAGLPRQCAQQAGGVQTGAGAEHAAPGQTHAQRQLVGHDVAGVGDVDKHAVKAALLDLVGIAPHGGNGEIHLRQTVMGLQQLDFANAVDDDIALAQIGEVTGPYRDAVGQVGRGVSQILHLAGQLLLLLVHQDQLVGDALHRQGVGHMRAHVAQADHTHNTFFSSFKNTPLHLFSVTCQNGGTVHRYTAWSAPCRSPE